MQEPTLDFDDIYDIWLASWWRQPGMLALLIFTLFAVFVVFYGVGRLRRNRPKKICPYRRLLDELVHLQAMQRDNVLQKRRDVVYLSDLFRAFFTAVSNVDCASLTENELILIIDKCACDDEIRRLIRSMLTSILQQKFSDDSDRVSVDKELSLDEVIARLRLLVENMKNKK